MSKKALGSLLLSVVVSAACLWYAFRGVDLTAMVEGIGRVGLSWVLISVLLALTGLIVRAMRWRFLLTEGERVAFWSLSSATFIGTMANNLLPARLGEVVRAWVLAQREGTPVPAVLASVVVERLLDIVAALMLMGLALMASPPLDGQVTEVIKQAGIVVVVVVAAGVTGLATAVRFRLRLLARIEREAVRTRRSWALQALAMAKNFLDGLCALRVGFQAVAVVGLSLLVWTVAIASFQAMAQGFHLVLTPAQTTLVFVIVLFGVAIPSAPGFVGTFHGFCVAGLGIIAGAEGTQAAAYATLLHGSHWLAINTVGIGCLLADRSLSWAGMLRLAREA